MNLGDRPTDHSAPTGWIARADLVAAALVALGLALRLVHLDGGLWYDEIRTLVEYARKPLATIVTTYDNQNQHLLYSVLARVAFLLLGDSAFALRLPAALLGTGSLWALYRFAARVTNPREALLATALMATSFHHLWFSQNARGYTALLLFSLIGTGALWRLLTEDRPGWGLIATYAAAMALGAYAHVTSVFTSVAHGVVVAGAWWTARDRDPGAIKAPAIALVLSGVIAAALYLPVVPQLLATPFSPGTESKPTVWHTPTWFVVETAKVLAQGLPGGWIGLVGGLVIATAGLVSVIRKSWALAALLVLPAVIAMGAALGLGHTLRPRFVFFSTGFGLLIAVRGMFALCQSILPAQGGAVATGALLLGMAATLPKLPGAWRPKQDFVAAARFVDSAASRGDAVVTVDLTAYPYQAYYDRHWPEINQVSQLEAAERDHPRTWLLYTFPIAVAAARPDVWERVTARYDTAAVFPGTVSGGDIVVMVSRRPEPGG